MSCSSGDEMEMANSVTTQQTFYMTSSRVTGQVYLANTEDFVLAIAILQSVWHFYFLLDWPSSCGKKSYRHDKRSTGIEERRYAQ